MARGEDLFDSVEQAWRSFRSDLADRIDQNQFDYILWELDVPERHEHPCGPYVQMRRSVAGDLIAEVSSNKVLHRKFRIRKAERRQLREAGWRRPDDANMNYWLPVDTAYADQAASMLVTALREVIGVIHPTFLVDGTAEEFAAVDHDDATEADLDEDGEAILEPAECLPESVTPTDRDHLVELVDRALGVDWGRSAPEHDGDGDIPYLCGTTVVFVRVLEEAPMIRAFAELVVGATDLEAAAFEVNVLNRDHGGVKFTLHGDVIRMSMDLPALPLVPYHLRTSVSHMCELAPKLDGDLARRVRGHRFLEPSEGEAD